MVFSGILSPARPRLQLGPSDPRRSDPHSLARPLPRLDRTRHSGCVHSSVLRLTQLTLSSTKHFLPSPTQPSVSTTPSPPSYSAASPLSLRRSASSSRRGSSTLRGLASLATAPKPPMGLLFGVCLSQVIGGDYHTDARRSRRMSIGSPLLFLSLIALSFSLTNSIPWPSIYSGHASSLPRCPPHHHRRPQGEALPHKEARGVRVLSVWRRRAVLPYRARTALK